MTAQLDQAIKIEDGRPAGAHDLDQITAGPGERTYGLILNFLLTTVLLALLVTVGISLGAGRQALWIVLISATFPITSLLVQSAIERLFTPAGPRKSLRSWLLHLNITILFYTLTSVTTVFAFLGSNALANRFGFELGLFDIRFASGQGILILIGSMWLAAIVSDFFFYWYHRATHVIPLLWQHHKMHHSDQRLEAISSARQNWIEAVFNALFIAVPMIILFKIDPMEQWETGILAGMTAAFLNNFLTLSHMNVRWQVGWLSRFWCSPQMHRIHHSLEPEHIDRNFAFVFPMWDVIFGTYYQPKKDEFPSTGVAGEDGFHSFWDAEIYSQREMWKFVRSRKANATAVTSG
ncbi:MAG: sterol desaturase family protein [Novosphingobium sp.]